MRSIRQAARLLLALLAATALQAQVDTRLRLTTDTLDAFKQGSAKPEVITILDFSGSMTAVTWHPAYSTTKDYDQHIYAIQGSHASDGQRTDLKTVDGPTSDAAYLVAMGSLTLKSGKTTSTLPAYALLPQVTGTLMSTSDLAGRLAASNGTLVGPATGDARATSGILDTSTWFRGFTSGTVKGSSAWILTPNHTYWLRQATHARLTYTPVYNKAPIPGATTRTVDIPLPYKLHEAPATAVAGVNDGAASKRDPKTGTQVQFDLVDGSADMAAAGGFIAPCDYNDDYLYWIFQGKKDGSFVIADSGAKTAWSNGLPVATRYQAVKRAVLGTWLDVQDSVFWAFRYLDTANENRQSSVDATNIRKTSGGDLKDSSLRLFAPISAAGTLPEAVTDLQAREASNATPLTFALANTLAQMVDGSVFAAQRAAEASPFADCRKHFVIAFTDGNANDAKVGASSSSDGSALGSGDPWAVGSATSGLAALKSLGLASLNPTKAQFNTWSLAGIAAHGAEGEAATRTTGSGSPSEFAPFAVKGRDGKTFSKAHPVQVMTVGVSLAGSVTDTGSDASKHNLLVTAGYGDPAIAVWDYTKFVPKNGTTGAPGEQPVAYYDATSNTALVASLNAIFKDITTANTSTTAPTAPVVGLRAGNQVYFGTFITAKSGPLWSGDLLMAALQVKADATVSLLGKDGAAITGPITADNAIWAASSVLAGADWASRRVYTYFGTPSPAGAFGNRGQKLDVDLTGSTQAFSAANTDLVAYMTGLASPATADKDAQKAHIAWMRGKDRTQRMGDVINSNPIGVEYNLALAKSLGLPDTDKPGARFRVVFVGTNHGFLHAFAEISWRESGVLKASAQELWSFIPKELLRKGPTYLQNPANPHAYLVDGSPAVYLDEERSTAGTFGVVDAPDGRTIQDKALVVFGLGRGGRATYALDITAPGTPRLAWAVMPDEEVKVGDQEPNPTLQTLGLATGDPALSRVWDGAAFRDLAFLAGGLSSDAVDAAFGTPLGRSLIALDVRTGALFKAWDFRQDTTLRATFPDIGSLAAPVVPFQALRRSNLTQRIYFSDHRGGIYALGSTNTQPAKDANPGFREDSSNPLEWTSNGTATGTPGVRKLYQAPKGHALTTSPVPFQLTQTFLGVPARSGVARPNAVGVVFGSGDRNDPMDKDTVNPVNPATGAADGGGAHRLVVLFDRQDSGVLGYDAAGMPESAVADLTAATAEQLNPNHINFYLSKSNAYFLRFAAGTAHKKASTVPSEIGGSAYFYEKIISEPLVLQSTLYFNLFEPGDKAASGLCGGTGETRTYRVWDVMLPAFTTGWASDSAANKSGQLFAFNGIAGRIAAVSTSMIAVPGNMTRDKGGAVVDTGGRPGVEVGTDVKPQRGPAVRLRSWRIVR